MASLPAAHSVPTPLQRKIDLWLLVKPVLANQGVSAVKVELWQGREAVPARRRPPSRIRM